MHSVAQRACMKNPRASKVLHRAVFLLLLLFGTSAMAEDFQYGFSGYLGYVAVNDDSDNIRCESRSCLGVFEDSIIYALLGSARYGKWRATVLSNQDEDGEPRLALAQISYSTLFAGWSWEARLGKIINPLGLYGANRITPTAAPRYELPQSFTLNTFFDVLTTSEYGFGLEARHNQWLAKATYYRPEKRTIENVSSTTTTDNSGVGAIPGVGGLLGGLLGGAAGGGTTTTTSTNQVELGLNSWYAGLAYEEFEWRVEFGTVQLDLGVADVSGYSLGFERELLPQFRALVEALYIDDDSTSEPTQGYSAAVKYELPQWQILAQYTDLRNKASADLKDASIGIGTERGPWSARLVVHNIFDLDPQDDNITNVTLLGAYSWR